MAAKLGPSYFRGRACQNLLAARIRARKSGKRLTYDCMGAVVQRDRVVCKFGHEVKGGGTPKYPSMPLLSVLKGISSKACQHCPDYDGETDE